MIKIIVYTFLLCVFRGWCQTIDWHREACLVGSNTYYGKVMQETMTMIEKDLRWSNLKMNDNGQVINETLFKWHATGTVNYTDGFLVSISRMDLTNMQGTAIRISVNGSQESALFVRGRLNLHVLNLGFDVVANLDNSGTHRFTLEYAHPDIVFETSITLNLDRKQLSTAASIMNYRTRQHALNYRPSNHITEMLSRSFSGANDDRSFRRWAEEIIAPRMLEVAKKLDFPTVRFDSRC